MDIRSAVCMVFFMQEFSRSQPYESEKNPVYQRLNEILHKG